jgi:hypothetical protein
MNYLKVVLAVVVFIAASIESHADSLHTYLMESEVPRITYSPPEGEMAQACVAQCLKTYKKCDSGYLKCSNALAEIEFANDNKAEDRYEECIREKQWHTSSMSAIDKEECQEERDYGGRNIDSSEWQTDDCQMPRLCNNKYDSCYLSCGGTLRLGDFELKTIETEITQADKLEIAPVDSKPCTLGSVIKCCEAKYNQCIVEPQRRKLLSSGPYTERAPEPMKGQASGPTAPTESSQFNSEQ